MCPCRGGAGGSPDGVAVLEEEEGNVTGDVAVYAGY